MGAGLGGRRRAEAARADGCRLGRRLRGRVPRRLDAPARRAGRRAPGHPLDVRLRRPAGRRSTASTGTHRAGRRRPRRRPGRQPAAVRRPDRGLGAHGPRLRADRGLPHRPRDRPPHQHDAAQPRHPPGQGRAADRRDPGRVARSRTRPTASRASARSASCRRPARSPPPCTTSTASGARRCRCDGRRPRRAPTSDRRPRPGSSAPTTTSTRRWPAGMPAPPPAADDVLEILEQIWWRLDAALDLEMIRWSAMLGALEALECGTHRDHRPPRDPQRDRRQPRRDRRRLRRGRRAGGVRLRRHRPPRPRRRHGGAWPRTSGSCAPAAAAWSACTPPSRAPTTRSTPPPTSPRDLGVGVHIHVAEGPVDRDAGARLAAPDAARLAARPLRPPRPTTCPGTIVHNPRSNMNNAVGYARPARFPTRSRSAPTASAPTCSRSSASPSPASARTTCTATPDDGVAWLETGCALVPEARRRPGDVDLRPRRQPWHLAYTPGVRPLEVVVDGEIVLTDGRATRVDAAEIRARAAEQAARLFPRL